MPMKMNVKSNPRHLAAIYTFYDYISRGVVITSATDTYTLCEIETYVTLLEQIPIIP